MKQIYEEEVAKLRHAISIDNVAEETSSNFAEPALEENYPNEKVCSIMDEVEDFKTSIEENLTAAQVYMGSMLNQAQALCGFVEFEECLAGYTYLPLDEARELMRAAKCFDDKKELISTLPFHVVRKLSATSVRQVFRNIIIAKFERGDYASPEDILDDLSLFKKSVPKRARKPKSALKR